MELLPYSFRPFQVELIETIESSVRSRGNVVLESGTGTGKTICSLVGTLGPALEEGKKIIYLTRTNSQQRQVMLELREINEKHPLLGVGLQGRQSTCPLIQRDPIAGWHPEELSNCALSASLVLCRARKAAVVFMRIYSHSFPDRGILPAPLTVEEFAQFGDQGLCPHELTKDLLPHLQ